MESGTKRRGRTASNGASANGGARRARASRSTTRPPARWSRRWRSTPPSGSPRSSPASAPARPSGRRWATRGATAGSASCATGCSTTTTASPTRCRRRPARSAPTPPARPSTSRTSSTSTARGPKKYIGDEKLRPHSALTASKQLKIQYRPYPVVGVISPWNFPLILSLGDALPALQAGAAVVIKPSEFTPLGLAEVVEAWKEEIGGPDVLDVVHGMGETGDGAGRRGRLHPVHRLGPHRQEGDGAGGRDADPGQPRARRQGPDDRARATPTSSAPPTPRPGAG